MIKEIFEQSENEYKIYTICRPYIQWNVDYEESIFDGLMFFLNPCTKNPLSETIINVLYNNGVNIVRYDFEKNEDVWSA